MIIKEPSAAIVPASTPGLTLHDFQCSGAARLIANHSDASLLTLQALLSAAAETEHAAGRTMATAMLVLLSRICSLVLQPSNRLSPLTHRLIWTDGTTSFDPSHLEPHDVALLAQLVANIDHVPLRARLADLVWQRSRRHGHGYPLRAIDDYRAVPPDPSTWHEVGYARWQRALQLAKELKGAAGERLFEMEDALIERFEALEHASGFDALHLLRPLTDERLGTRHTERILKVLERRGREAVAAHNAFEADGYLKAAKTWFDRARQPDRAAEMQALLAAAWENHADAAADAAIRHAFYEDAIRTYRTVPAAYRISLGIKAALQRTLRKYEQAGRDAVGEMVLFRGPEINLTPFAEQAVEYVRKAEPLAALFAFCTLHRLPSKRKYLSEAAQHLDDEILMRMMGVAHYAEDGRVVARTRGVDAGAEIPAQHIEARAMQDFANDAGMIGHALIGPALEQLHLDHVLTVNDFKTLAERSGIVPADRAAMVGKALHAGYQNDLEHALHVLLPQFEHLIREELKVANALTTTHTPQDGLDMEIGLSSLTERPEMIEVFGEDRTFAIRALMCVEPGPNLRNMIAHGLADSECFQGPHARYVWWFILRMVVREFRVRCEQGFAIRAGRRDGR
jgi:hypothetical protein